MSVCLRAKFQVSSITLTSFRQGEREGGGGNFTHPPNSKRTPKKPTQIKVKRLYVVQKIFVNSERKQNKKHVSLVQ